MGDHYGALKICQLNGPRAGKGVAAFAVLECRNSLKGSLAYILSGERTGKTRRARAVDIGNRLILYGSKLGPRKSSRLKVTAIRSESPMGAHEPK